MLTFPRKIFASITRKSLFPGNLIVVRWQESSLITEGKQKIPKCYERFRNKRRLEGIYHVQKLHYLTEAETSS